MFLKCYFFDILHTKKDSIIFALYSSNWTEMDMKCKKLISLAMNTHNAHQKKLQYTKTRIVNLEIFYKTIGYYYSVISVFVNCVKKGRYFGNIIAYCLLYIRINYRIY
ncbi:uncharacterized protein LOC111026938 [Myzus persicae]|uniref:uncharacterized protein LOC111026938 n=1 Tax=Myzus persicae TaxID=13164 RepID=UPI000B935D7D|nr:uncharacterized protein LOC111026938 [Myzus persicae]